MDALKILDRAMYLCMLGYERGGRRDNGSPNLGILGFLGNSSVLDMCVLGCLENLGSGDAARAYVHVCSINPRFEWLPARRASV